MLPRQPIKLSDLDKSHMKRGGLLNKHISDFFSNISNETAEIVNFHISHDKSMGTISCYKTRVLIRPEHKTQLFIPLTYRCYMCDMERICFKASEEKSIENVENGQTTDTSMYYKLTSGSGELRLRPKMILTMYKGGNPKVLNQNSSRLRDFDQAFGPQLSIFYYLVFVFSIWNEKIETLFCFPGK